ncbi:MAG: transposase, partial [Terriglobales bacterium]
GYDSLGERGYAHLPVAECGDGDVAEEFLPISHLIFSNLKSWLRGCHHGRVEPKHLQAYLNEFAFRFDRRLAPFSAFRSLLGIGAGAESPTYDELYSGEWKHPSRPIQSD